MSMFAANKGAVTAQALTRKKIWFIWKIQKIK
jgi:hypothetical protein